MTPLTSAGGPHPASIPASIPTPPHPTASGLSYVPGGHDSPWHTYLAQVERVIPYLGDL